MTQVTTIARAFLGQYGFLKLRCSPLLLVACS